LCILLWAIYCKVEWSKGQKKKSNEICSLNPGNQLLKKIAGEELTVLDSYIKTIGLSPPLHIPYEYYDFNKHFFCKDIKI
jgi:hypothetical protein